MTDNKKANEEFEQNKTETANKLDDHLEEVGEVQDDTVVGKMFRNSIFALVGIGAIVGIIYFASQDNTPEKPTEISDIPAKVIEKTVDPTPVKFTDITKSAGIDFVHFNGAEGEKLMPETLGSGVGFFDFDNDGDQDLLFVNGNHWPWSEKKKNASKLPTQKIYENDGTGKFTDVTAGSGLDVSFYGTGVAFGDYDNDGDQDVFISAVGENKLFRNDSKKESPKFVDVTDEAKVAGSQDAWSTSVLFFDADNDEDLDVFVGNYVKWSRDIDLAQFFSLDGQNRAYGPPMTFEGSQPYFYQNNGDGTFTEIAEQAGLHIINPASKGPMYKALGACIFDVNGDNLLDLFIANDTTQNFAFINKSDELGIKFKEQANLLGVAFDSNGSSTGAMGIDIGHYRNDKSLGLFVGNFANEMTSLYVAEGGTMLFSDQAVSEGIGGPTRSMLSFGVLLMDYDLDGRLDLFQTNGHLEEEINKFQKSQHYEQPSQIFWNAGPDAKRCFIAVPQEETGDLAKPVVGRGASYADIDNDGDLDVVITQTGRAPLLLRNDLETENNYIKLDCKAFIQNADKVPATMPNHLTVINRYPKSSIGAKIDVICGDRTYTRYVLPSKSYLSQMELPVTIGIGNEKSADVTVTWPTGEKVDIKTIPINEPVNIFEGGMVKKSELARLGTVIELLDGTTENNGQPSSSQLPNITQGSGNN